MGSNSGRRSGSSGRSAKRRKVVISAGDTSRVRDTKPQPKVDKRRRATGRSSGNVNAAARKAATAKAAEREARLKARRRRIQGRVALIAVVLCVVVLGLVSLYRSQLFSIETVEISGNERLSRSQVETVAAMPPGATLLRFPGAEMTERLEADPWIRSATVTRDFPDTISIRITERRPIAFVDVGAELFWLVDEFGYMIAEEAPEATATAGVVIRDVPGLDPRPGKRTVSETLLNALEVWKGLSQDLKGQVRAISAESIDKTTLITYEDIEVLVGSAEDIGSKDSIARRILQEQAGAVVYINVRSVDRPTWRGLDEE